MTTVTLKIQVDKSGASENIGAVKRDLKEMGDAGAAGGQQAAGGVNTLGSAINGAKAAVAAFLSVYAAIQTLSGVVRLADEYQGLSDRLRLATGSSAEFAAAQSGVFAIAQQTGTALGSVSDLYARLARSTDALGLSSGQLLTITESITQAFVVSGAGAGESDAAIRQLSQAFASGVLRGDEFNSVMENAPRLAQALADSLGVTAGELRKMAADGKLTSDILAQGLLTQAPAIASEFDQMGTTVGRAFTQVKNSVLVAVGAFNESTGATDLLASSLSEIAQVIANVATLFVQTGERSVAASEDVGVLTRAFQFLAAGAALVVNAVQAMVQFVAGAIAGVSAYLSRLASAAEAAATGSFESLKNLLTLDVVGFAESQLGAAQRAFGELRVGATDATDAMQDGLSGVIAETDDFSRTLTAILQPLDQTARKTESVAGALGGVTVATKAATAATEKHTAKVKDATDAADDARRAFAGVTGTLTVTTGAFDGVQASASAMTDEVERSSAASQDWSRYWTEASGAVTDAFADLLSGGIDSLEDFGGRVLDISKQIVSDIIKEFARTGQIKLPPGMFGQGGTGFSIGGSLQALSLAYAGFQNARAGGSPLATVGAFTLSGAQIAGPIGAAIGAVVGAITSIFGGPDDPLLRVRSSEFSGNRRSEGRATSDLGNIFIRTEALGENGPTSPEIAQRIADFDNLIAGFLSPDQLTTVRTALENVNDTFRNGAATVSDAIESRLSTIVGSLGENVAEFVGQSGTLEQRIGRLADALTITAAAATGLISSDFTEVADVLQRFRARGEDLQDTFFRVVSAMSLVDDTLLLLGGSFNGTRLQAANFAGELIELAGGFDQFAQRLNGALQALFSEEERNQFAADQARRALDESLRGLNITGSLDSVRTQLRDQLRAALEAGNSELVNRLLIAGNALGAFSTAVEALGEDAVAAARQIAFGSPVPTAGGSIVGGGLNAPAGTGTPQTQLQASVSAATSLQAHTSLLTRIADNTQPRADQDVATKAARDGSDASRSAAETLKAIKALLEQQNRANTSEALKRAVGANKRAATA